jgi:hypothetical protein
MTRLMGVETPISRFDRSAASASLTAGQRDDYVLVRPRPERVGGGVHLVTPLSFALG